MDGHEAALHHDEEIEYDWVRSGTPIGDLISDLAELSQDIANDVQEMLAERHASDPSDGLDGEDEFSSETQYEEIEADAGFWHNMWESFTEDILKRNRFFNSGAEEKLDRIFSGLSDMRTSRKEPVCIDAGPGTEMERFHRARVFRSDDELAKAIVRPDLHIGPTPSFLAASGRMNARGISVFYGSDKPDAALAEVRPPVGSHVVVATFVIVRRLKLLDLRALERVFIKASLFDPQADEIFGRSRFLRSLRERMTMPAMKDDDITEYLPTQAVADYLSSDSKHSLDGIVFPSVQVRNDAANVVLFNKASRVEAISYPDGSRVTADTWENGEDGRYRYFATLVEIGAMPRRPEYEDFRGSEYVYKPIAEVSDERDVTLRVDMEEVMVHAIQGLRFDTDSQSVHRMEWTLDEKKDF